jgi:hypothetical protein
MCIYNERISRYQVKNYRNAKNFRQKYILLHEIKRPGNITHVNIYVHYRHSGPRKIDAVLNVTVLNQV